MSGDVVLSNGESEQCLIGSPTEVGSVGRGRRGRPSRDSTGDSLSPRHAVLRFIDEIESSQNSWPFLEPVDPKEAPDYYEVIKNPVDLSMIRRWTIEGRYDNEGLAMLARDLGDMFYNAELYNSMDSEVWQAGSRFEQLIRNKFAKTRPSRFLSQRLFVKILASTFLNHHFSAII
ncbi:unnamed protein product [Protopolystoma xenopodis]|uniref:Bromo domain-containing protein n=1 Tax=Protopolystoma xenopodis TaxID=117903 RepID=A0A3S5A6T7_9PLAT|nr:unnamed protein product [Protopolystoma xenopodis]